MKEFIQAADFYRSLDDDEKNDLADAIAVDIFFLEDDLQEEIIEIMGIVDKRLASDIAERNGFTI
ncbi:MAG: hypothetical protein MR884_06230 [Clostridiales bacterium]|jgi:catalase|nr:hypothetical protein [Clostridiales bacterium]